MIHKLLDCTFRDGGYYTNWQFDDSLVRLYLSQINLKHVEIGYVCPDRNGFGNVTPETIELFRINLPESALYLISDYPMFFENTARKLYKDLKVDCVRLVVDFDKVENSKPVLEELKLMGYEVSLNISKFNMLENLPDTIKLVDRWECVDVIYLADSLGTVTPDYLRNSLRICQSNTDKKLGFHGHDNKGLASYNSLVALSEGIDLVDCTVCGMGKGSGNAATEEMLHYLGGDSILQLVVEFEELRKEFKWGKNFLYFLASEYKVNPSYIYKMIQNELSVESIAKKIPLLEEEFEFNEEVYNKFCI